jgi:hypothetical protein
MSYTPPCETIATAASRSIFETLAAYVVLAHSIVMFHPCTCGLRGDDAALLGYDNRGVYCWETCEEETIVIDYFIYTDA